MNMPDSLYKKMQTIQKNVVALSKDGKNKFLKFDYVSAEQTIGTIREEMNKVNLMLIPSITGYNIVNLESGRIMVNLTFNFKWVDTDSGEEKDFTWYANGCDPEMGTGKAITYGTKYYLWSVFLIPRDGDDPDATMGKEGVAGAAPTASMKSLQRLNTLIKETGSGVVGLLAYYKVEKLTNLTEVQALDAIKQLEAKGK
jgi:hypothetical protein